MEDGEDERQALAREILEELGLTVHPLEKLAESPGDVADQTTHWWSCEIVAGALRPDTAELADAGYFTRQQMQSMRLWPATQDFFAKYIFHEE